MSVDFSRNLSHFYVYNIGKSINSLYIYFTTILNLTSYSKLLSLVLFNTYTRTNLICLTNKKNLIYHNIYM